MKIALVTGAYKGLGFEWCKQLGKQGYKLILTAREFEKASFRVKKKIFRFDRYFQNIKQDCVHENNPSSGIRASLNLDSRFSR